MTPVILLFALAIGIWLVPLVRSGRIPPLATIVLLAGTIAGPAFFSLEAPIPISLDRLLWLGLFGVLAIRWRMGELTWDHFHRLDGIVLAMAVWLLISARLGGTEKSAATARWLFYVAMPVGMYAVSRLIKVRDLDIRWVTWSMFGLALYLSVTALLEVTGLHGFVFPRYIVDSESWEFYGRGRGPLLNPAGNGIVITIGLAAGMIGFLRAGRRGKLLFGIALLILAGGIYATLTRSVWLGAMAAIGTVGVIHAPRWARVLGVASVVLIGGAAAMGLKDQIVRLKRDKHLSAADSEKSMELRPLLAVVGWEMFKERPLVGHGFGHYFEHAGPFHSRTDYGLPLKQAKPYAQHNIVLSILVDTGLVGLTLFMAVLASFFGIGWQLSRQRGSCEESRWVGLLMLCTLAAYLCNGMFQDVLIIPMVHMFLFFIGGLAITVHARGVVPQPQHAQPGGAPLAIPALRSPGSLGR